MCICVLYGLRTRKPMVLTILPKMEISRSTANLFVTSGILFAINEGSGRFRGSIPNQ